MKIFFKVAKLQSLSKAILREALLIKLQKNTISWKMISFAAKITKKIHIVKPTKSNNKSKKTKN